MGKAEKREIVMGDAHGDFVDTEGHPSTWYADVPVKIAAARKREERKRKAKK